MDYHVINNAEFLDDFQKPMMLWTKGDMLAYVSHLDSYVDTLKRDYQTIVDYQELQEETIMSPQQKERITNAVVSWAHDRQEIIDDSEDVAFPMSHHINTAEINEDRISGAVNVAIDILEAHNIESEGGQRREEEEREKEKSPLGQLSDIAMYGAIGLGLFLAYKIFTEYRR